MVNRGVMAIDLNMDMGALLKSLFSKKSKAGDKPAEASSNIFANIAVKQSMLKIVLTLCVTTIMCFLVNFFTANPIKKTNSEFENLSGLQDAMDKLDANLISAKSLFSSNKKKVSAILPLFSELHGEKTIFKQITRLAAGNDMIIKSVNQISSVSKDKPLDHAEVQILLNISGYYSNYLNFKKELEKNKPYLRIDNEVLTLNQSIDGDRSIDISVNLTDYAMPLEQYEALLQKNY